ncbi:hypothetical protein JHD48_10080, partial [Sulfurimonas sp. SAG-AH-194-I05]
MNKKDNKFYLFDKYSHSPFSKNGEDTHLDSLIDYHDYNDIYFMICEIYKNVNIKLFNKYFKGDYNYLGDTLDLIDANRLSTNLYVKSLILEKVYNLHSEKDIVLSVYDEELDFYQKGINGLSANRFANHYAWLASKLDKLFNIKNIGNINIDYEKDVLIKNKFLRYINIDIKVFVAAFLKKINFFSVKKNIFTFTSSELTREIVANLTISGIANINIRQELNSIYYDSAYQEKLTNIHYNDIYKIILESFENYKVPLSSEFLKSYCSVIAEVISYNIEFLKIIAIPLRKKVNDLKHTYNNSNICLTNGLFGDYGLSIADALIHHNIKIISNEHGLTTGNNLASLYNIKFKEARTSHVILSYTNSSKKLFEENTQAEVICIGAPNETKKIKLFNLQNKMNKYRL